MKKKGKIYTATALLLALALLGSVGCSAPLSNREKGGLLGAGLGAGTGAIIGSATGHAAAGAAIGGIDFSFLALGSALAQLLQFRLRPLCR